MAQAAVTNPFGALRKVSDFTTLKSDDGDAIGPGQSRTVIVRANAAVGKGEVVNWVIPTTTVPLSVTPMATGTVGSLFAGVALAAAASGEDVQICTYGFCFADFGAGTPAFGSVVAKPTTTGKALVSAALDATTIVGTIIGVALAAKDANNLAPMIVEHM